MTPRCKDCIAEGVTTDRPIAIDKKTGNPVPARRCATHHRAAKKTRRRSAADRNLMAQYGLTRDEYDAIYRAQGGRCYFCRWARGNLRALCVDHDHKTGQVRGLLCVACNSMLGQLARDTVEFFQRCIDYLTYADKHPDGWTFASQVLGRKVLIPGGDPWAETENP